jgi:hypothetical protein
VNVTWRTGRPDDRSSKGPKSLILVTADMARSNPPMTAPFVSEFVRGLQGQNPALALALTWVEQRLADDGLTTEELVQIGNQGQAADQVTLGNSIGSLRFLASVDWHSFVEAMSAVDRVLRDDPIDAYAQMDFETRNRYRVVIERVARRSEQSEPQVAATAIQLARDAMARRRPMASHRAQHMWAISWSMPAWANSSEPRGTVARSSIRCVAPWVAWRCRPISA